MAKKRPPIAKARGPIDDTRNSGIPPERVRPTQPQGGMGTVITGGYVQSVERDPSLQGVEKYVTFGEALANVSVIAAAVRLFLNMIAAATWKVEPAKDSGEEGQKLADRVDDQLKRLRTSWSRVVRKAAMFRFYGSAVLEWVMRRGKGEDAAAFELDDVQIRPQSTIEQWDTSVAGDLIAVVQRIPQTGTTVAIPREKLVYLVDDALSDSPEGLGLLRQAIPAARRLQRYEQLEGFGFEGDLQGIPLLRAPLAELIAQKNAGLLSIADVEALLQPFRNLLANHVRNPSLGMMIDSDVYRSKDATAAPSATPKWDAKLMEGGQYALVEVAAAIMREVTAIARIFGVEHLLLGSQTTSGGGSYALSKDKSHSFALVIAGVLNDLREAFERDLLGPLWLLNGWDDKLKPTLVTDTSATQDIEQLSAVLRNLASSGVMLDREDDAVAELFKLMGLPAPKGQLAALDPDGQLLPNGGVMDEDEADEALANNQERIADDKEAEAEAMAEAEGMPPEKEAPEDDGA